MKIFRCSIWHDIQVSPLALKIIDTIEFQRLHGIKQCGVLYKVFPCTTHTRFQHSLGVYHFTKLFLANLEKNSVENLNLTPRKKEMIAISGLCHDLGHGPFSHLFDLYLESQQTSCDIPKTHEERSVLIFQTIIKKYKIDFSTEEIRFICNSIQNPDLQNWQNLIVNNPISYFDTDKCDYLLRDSQATGFPINFDIHRILNNIIVHDNEIQFCNKIKFEIEKLFLKREDLHQNIYRHHAVDKFQSYLLEKLKEANLHVDLQSFLQLNDEMLLSKILNQKERLYFETRTWESFSTPTKTKFQDNQKEMAMKNLKWYDRKQIYSTID